VREARQRDGKRQRLQRYQSYAGERKRDDKGNRLKGPEPTPALEVARIDAPSPRNRGELGKGGLGH
jgi:hypothetical protein